MKPNISKKKLKDMAIRLLEELQSESEYDGEGAHGDADDILCQLLNTLGYSDVVDAYNKINKWCA